MTVAITDSMGAEYKFDLYVQWLLRGDRSISWTRISYQTHLPEDAASYDGILLSGGGDVDPALYGGNTGYANLDRVDAKRDKFELGIIDVALRRQIPLLGICRGLQLINVHSGGSLYEDLQEAGFPDHESRPGTETWHTVTVTRNSLVGGITGKVQGKVNSHHHQAVHRPGEGLVVTARTADGVVEGLERSCPDGGQFFLAVQWHPERMDDEDNPFTSSLRARFIQHIRTHSTQR